MKKFKYYEFNNEYSKLTPYYKQQRNEVIARRLQVIVETLKLSSINDVSYDEAVTLWNKQNNTAGINCEITLGRTLRLWGIHARRLPRSGKAKKTKRPKLEPNKPCDIKLTIDGNEIFVESKLRSNPRTLYDDIMNNPKCYHIHFEDYDYYVLSENDFKKMIVDLEYPNIKESDRKVKYYHDLYLLVF